MAASNYFAGCIDNQNRSQRKEVEISEIGAYTRNIYGYGYNQTDSKKEYTVLLAGASKCGKSTIVDGFANFFMGIKSNRINNRCYVTRNNTDKEDTMDKEAFYFYTFCTKDTVFNFIDSPSITNDLGFVDTKRKELFNKFINDIKERGIIINAVGLVIQNHFVRLPPAEEKMLKIVTDVVGEANISHIIPFITYADANTPPVLDALKSVGIHTEEHLVFNNVCFNPSIVQITEIDKICWRRGLDNIQKGVNIITRLKQIDLLEIHPAELYTYNNIEQSSGNKIENKANRMKSLTDHKTQPSNEEYGETSNCAASDNKIERIIRETYDENTKCDCKICGKNHYLEFMNTRGPKVTQLRGISPQLSGCTTCKHHIREHTFKNVDGKEVVKLTVKKIKTEYGLRNDAEAKKLVKNWVPKENKARYIQYRKIILEHLWWDDFSGAL